MLKPTRDNTLKTYLIKSIQEYVGGLDVNYKDKPSDVVVRLNGLATKILRHLNELGYVKMPKPSIHDKEPQQPTKSDLADFWDGLDNYNRPMIDHFKSESNKRPWDAPTIEHFQDY